MKDVLVSDLGGPTEMNLRDYLVAIAQTYDRSESMSSSAQKLLRDAQLHLQGLTPAGYKVAGSGGKGTPTFTPWVGLFDPDETTDPGQGLYVVYLFSADLASVTLMLLQGVTRLREELRGHPKRQDEVEDRLRRDAEGFRERISGALLAGWASSVELGAGGWRQRAYEAGSVVARRYDIDALPSEAELRKDLWHVAEIYQRAVESRADSSLLEEGVRALMPTPTPPVEDPLADFRPKDDADYVARFSGGEQRKKRRHEWLIGEYGPALARTGFRVSTKVHPQDLMVFRDDARWIVEAKVVYDGNATSAVREALAQLLEYRHLLHKEAPFPSLLALFTEEVGPAYVDFLTTLGIASVWKTSDGWEGSKAAIDEGLVPAE